MLLQPVAGAVDVSPAGPATVAVPDGTVDGVTLTGPDGTAVAGVIAASSNNGVGLVGVMLAYGMLLGSPGRAARVRPVAGSALFRRRHDEIPSPAGRDRSRGHARPRHDVRPHLAPADCVVLPSYREGTPKTLLEAAAMGKPLITTNVPGCKETVVDGLNGYLCEVRNAQDLQRLHLGRLAVGAMDHGEARLVEEPHAARAQAPRQVHVLAVHEDARLEASGSVTLDNVRDIADTGVDFISNDRPPTHHSFLPVAASYDVRDSLGHRAGGSADLRRRSATRIW